MRNVALVLSLFAATPTMAADLLCGTVGGNPSAVEESLAAKAATAGDTVVDVGLAYDQSFATEAGGNDHAVVALTMALARANAGHTASGTRMQYRVVGVKRLSYNLDPHNPIGSADSAETRSFRDVVGADLVLVGTLRPYNSTGTEVGGIAHLYTGNSLAYLGIVGYYASQGVTPGHELGHCGGADHEDAAHPPPSQAPPARAYYFCPPDGGKGYADQMVSGTSRPSGGCTWEALNLFSSPTIKVDGVPLGVPGKADNASVLRATAATVAGFRTAKTDTSVCVPGSTTLCLQGGRFKVEAVWRAGSQTGHGGAIALTSDTGYFWFFAATNVEVVIKVLNACPQPFNRFWVFTGGLTDVEVGITVTDTKTGAVKTYYNPAGIAFPPMQDTDAFATCP